MATESKGTSKPSAEPKKTSGLTTVTNNTQQPIAIAGETIPAGGSFTFDNWGSISKSKAVAAWIKAGVVTV